MTSKAKSDDDGQDNIVDRKFILNSIEWMYLIDVCVYEMSDDASFFMAK